MATRPAIAPGEIDRLRPHVRSELVIPQLRPFARGENVEDGQSAGWRCAFAFCVPHVTLFGMLSGSRSLAQRMSHEAGGISPHRRHIDVARVAF